MLRFDSLIAVVRTAAVFTVAALAVICVIDWLVRTRRINPFNPIARFCRSTVDPFIAPIERRVVRAGGMPSAAPWWALVAAVVGAILLITLLRFVRDQAFMASIATHQGTSGILALVVGWAFAFLRLAIIVRVIASWLPVSPYSPWLRWAFVITEPILRPLRQIIPLLGPIDITPIIAYFLLGLLARFFVGAL